MRSALLALILIAACGDNNGSKPDAGNHHGDGAVTPIDAKEFLDAPPPMAVDGTIADVRAAADGVIAIKLSGVTVTYIKPQIGDPTSDPAGYTIQTDLAGPAIFVAVDPTVPIALVAGDVVNLTVTQKTTVGGQPRVTMISAIGRLSQGADLAALTQNISASTDLVTALGTYDSELVTITGTLTGAVGSSGSGFSKFQINTAGITGVPALQLRAPTALMNAIDMTTGCTITATQVPFSEFLSGATTMNAEIGAYSASNVTLSGCAVPVMSKAVATAIRTIRVTFSRNIDPNTVQPDGTQFTIAGFVVNPAPVVAGRTVTLTVTTDQAPLANYTVVLDNSVHPLKDLQGSTVATTLQENFLGYTTPATVLINEINGNITGSCDMIELRVKTDGSLGNFRLTERDGSTINYVFPASLQVHKNDFVIVHFGGTSATCNPAPAATDELTDPAGQTHLAHGKNFDTAFDLYSTSAAGLTNTTNVYTLYDPTDTIVDAVFGSDATTSAVAAATLNQAAVVGTAVQWEPHATSYDDVSFRAAAITDITLSGASQSLFSIQRLTDVDTNAKADWSTGAGLAPTWGALNAGQLAF